MLKLVYNDTAVTMKKVYNWFERFRNGCKSAEDEERSRRPSTSKTQENVESVCCFFATHCILRLIVRSELDVPTFATSRLHACHHAKEPSGGTWNCGREMFWKFA